MKDLVELYKDLENVKDIKEYRKKLKKYYEMNCFNDYPFTQELKALLIRIFNLENKFGIMDNFMSDYCKRINKIDFVVAQFSCDGHDIKLSDYENVKTLEDFSELSFKRLGYIKIRFNRNNLSNIINAIYWIERMDKVLGLELMLDSEELIIRFDNEYRNIILESFLEKLGR